MDSGTKLYERFVDGDESALGEMVEQYFDSMVLFVNQYLNDFHAAEDIVEDTFAKVLMKKFNYAKKSSFKTYLYKAARNDALSYLRKHKGKTVDFEALALSANAEHIEEQLIHKDEMLRLYRCIEKLPPQYKEFVHLHYLDELSYDEIALVLHKNKTQLKNLSYRAKAALKELYEKEGGSDEID